MYSQFERDALGIAYKLHFVITENDTSLPYGFNSNKARLIAEISQDKKLQKLLLLVGAFVCALGALSIGNSTILAEDIDDEVNQILAVGRQELLLSAVKHRLALASKSQGLLFLDEMKALIAEFGSPEGEILTADEVNATDKFTNAGYLVAEGIPVDSVVTQTWGYQPGTTEHQTMKTKFIQWFGESEQAEESSPNFRTHFPESIDSASWKAIQKALDAGLDKSSIIADVLGCKGTQTELGEAYFDYLQKRFAIVIGAKNHD